MSGAGYVSREEFETLVATVSGLQARVTGLEATVAQLTPEAAAASEFEVVGTSSTSSVPEASVAEAAAELSGERIAIAHQIGAWIKRCLNSERRGLSGREELDLHSKFYIVVRGFDSVVHNPPLVFTSWSGAKTLTHIHGQPGDSIFVGVPSKAEVRAVSVAAGLAVPTAYRR